MEQGQRDQAARILWESWRSARRIDTLPDGCRPRTRAEGYRIQEAIVARSGDDPVGWKIAATSTAGQRHINVTAPMAGRLLRGHVHDSGETVPLEGNLMRVGEAEFAFRLGRDLPPHGGVLDVGRVLDSVASLHPAIEAPDSRFANFARAGEAQLIADNACVGELWLGPPADEAWRDIDLSAHRVTLLMGGVFSRAGAGSNVLGDPRAALAWVVNELHHHGYTLRAGEIVTTGTCNVPVELRAGDVLRADFGSIGRVEARFS